MCLSSRVKLWIYLIIIILMIIVSIPCAKAIYDTYNILRSKNYVADEELDEDE
jgi:hypothetical protein